MIEACDKDEVDGDSKAGGLRKALYKQPYICHFITMSWIGV